MEGLSWSTVEQVFKQHFLNTGLSITVCSGVIVIPPVNQREEIIKEFHESVIGGHKGASKTYWRVRSNYFWENMKSDVQRIVKNCKNCQRNKLVRQGTRQPMFITDTPKQPFEKVQIDMVGPLPVTSKGNSHILTIQCVFSKYSDAYPLQNTDSVTIARVLAEQFIARYGCPQVIHTDQGSNFISQVFKTFCRIFKIKKIQSTAYHPQSLGSLERSHQTLIEYLRQFQNKQDWDEWLRFAVFSYNTSVHEATGFAPYTLVFGKEASIPNSFVTNPPDGAYCDYLKDLFLKLDNVHSLAHERILKAKEKSKKYYDRKVNPKLFHEGHEVYLKVNLRKDKFSPYYAGPYVLERLLGERNALIRLGPNKTKIVHTDQLKLATPPCNDG